MESCGDGLAATKDGGVGSTAFSATESRSGIDLAGPVRQAVARTRTWLLDRQHPDGYWVAELEGDTILESETILLLAFLGREDSELARRCARYLLEKQLPGGGWAMYPGGGVEISGSVKAYFALKLTGHDAGAESMVRARRAILARGGADAVNSYTRFFLAMLGQIPYRLCPSVPPEAVLLPKWFPVNLYAVSTWSRTIIVPLSIVSALEPVRRLPRDLRISELFLREPRNWPPLRCPGLPGGSEPPGGEREQGLVSWDKFFRVVDRLLKACQRLRCLPRRRAIRAATRWMLDRFSQSDGLGAIFPPIVFSLVALRALGYDDDSPEATYCHRQLADLVLEDSRSGSIRLQPCKSPVWDTAIAVRALAESGADIGGPAMLRAFGWLLDQQITRPGDWCETVDAEPGGWCFEFHNDFYPDSDDTAMVLMALAEQFGSREAIGSPFHIAAEPNGPGEPSFPDAKTIPDPLGPEVGLDDDRHVALISRTAEAVDRGLKWVLAMQNDDGGWGAFDRNNNRQFLCYVPFADHNAMIDPSTPDLTGRVLEALGKLGRRAGDPVVDRAVAYLRRAQERDGSWFGRWGVNYIYGTWQALAGLAGAGVSSRDPAVVAAANWLVAFQQDCGGWGESPDSYADPSQRGRGPATASQTAWAVMGLIAAGLGQHAAAVRGIRFLLQRQNSEGTWDETEFTGTGFPRVFYLRYHYYPVYFPLMALARWGSLGG